MTRILGAVLAGGRSSRFGSDKAVAMLDGRTLAEHAAAAIAPFVEAIVMVGIAGGVPDIPCAGRGPLGGIAGALDHAERHGFDAVLTIACDMPVVPDGVIDALLRRSPSYCVDAPVLGLWPVSALNPVMTLLAEQSPSPSGEVLRWGVSPNGSACGGTPPPTLPLKERGEAKTAPSIRAFARAIGAIPVEAPCPIPNVNTREDLLAL